MRTMIIILGGFVLLAACIGVARLAGGNATASMSWAVKIFIAVWLLVAAANMWIGVSQAGYSVREELPIFLLIFLLPVAVAVFVKWKFF